MKRNLIKEEELEWSSIVANNSMNRDRVATGINSYEKDIKLNPIKFILDLKNQDSISWIDLCCGSGNALIEVSNFFSNSNLSNNLHLLGIDLVEYFSDHKKSEMLTLRRMNLTYWNPESKSDLITCVHGLHYVGDKIKLILKSISALKESGIFIANIDLANIKIEGVVNSKNILMNYFKSNDIDYNLRTNILKVNGFKKLENNFHYIGADDKAGPNYTGQEAINSIYKLK